MAGRTGGKINKGRDGEQNVYFHQSYAKDMVAYLEPYYRQYKGYTKTRILDACAGDGVLGHELHAAIGEGNLKLVDIKNGDDILQEKEEYDIIICNPPWKLTIAYPIYLHLMDLLKPRGILFFIINNVFCYQGSSRAEKLSYQKFYFLPRWVFQPSGRPLLDCGVMVCQGSAGEILGDAAMLRPYIPIKRLERKRKVKKLTQKKVQDVFNKAIRERDKQCIISGSRESLQCSHYYPVGGNRGLRYYPHNAHAMRAGVHIDHHQGDTAPYQEWMETYKSSELNWMRANRKKSIKYTQEVLRDILNYCNHKDFNGLAEYIRQKMGE